MLRELCAEAVKSKTTYTSCLPMRGLVANTVTGKTVCQEVRSILSPLPFSARPGSSSSGSLMLERRPKRKGKAKLAAEKYRFADTPKGRKPARTFQKKLVVIDYMGRNAPRSFALKEVYVWMRGMLPEIEMTASEQEVRGFISNTISFSPIDFEFMEASGKCLCVPAQQAKFEWTGRAVKQLAGTGAVYIRLREEREEGFSEELSDSSDSLPDLKISKGENSGRRGYIMRSAKIHGHL